MILNPIIKNSQAGEYAHIIASAPHGATVTCDGVAGSEVRTVNPAWKGLPSGYKQVEYLESSGTEYIDTNFKLTNNSVLYTRFAVNSLTATDNIYIAIYGSGDDGASFSYTDYSSYRKWGTYWGGVSYGGLYGYWTLSLDTFYEYTVSKTGEQLGNTYVSRSGGNITSDRNMYLFRNNHAQSSLLMRSKAKISAFNSTNNGNYEINLVPCIRTSDSVAGMYDLVSETFLTNAGTGSFTAGSEVPHYLDTSTWTFDIDTYGEHIVYGAKDTYTDTQTVNVLTATDYLVTLNVSKLPTGYTELDYIGGSGTQYINSGLYVSYPINIDFYYQCRTTPTNGCFIGAFTDSNGMFTAGTNSNFPTFFQTASNIAVRNYGGRNTNKNLMQLYATSSSTRITINGSAVTNSGTTSTPNIPIYIFGCNSNGTAECNDFVNIYEITFTINGNVVWDGIPCINASNEVGMYDLVSKTFFGNAGTGSFIAGNPV